jgi:hypothetical protein
VFLLLLLHFGAVRFAWTKMKEQSIAAGRPLAWPIVAVVLYLAGALVGLFLGALLAVEFDWSDGLVLGLSFAMGAMATAPAYLLLRARTVVRVDTGPIQSSNPATPWYLAFGVSLLAIVGVGVVTVVGVVSIVEQNTSVFSTGGTEGLPEGVAGVVYGTVVLEDDVLGTVFVVENATLDCDGHVITGTGSRVGVVLADGATVRNCNVNGFNSGVGFNGVSRASAENVTVSGSRIGFYLLGGADESTIVGSTAKDNEIGFLFETGVTNAQLTGNEAVNNWRSGYMIDNATDSEFSENTAIGGGSGFWVIRSHRNTFVGNTVIGANDWFSIGLFESSSENVFIGNEVTEGNVAIALDVGAHSNHFENNVLTSNTKGTHVMSGSGSGNSFVGNTVSRNSHVGLWDDRANFNEYADNICSQNRDAASVPDGLCD